MYFVQLRNHNHKRTWGWEWDEKGCQFLLRMYDVVSGRVNSEPFLFVRFKKSQKCSVFSVLNVNVLIGVLLCGFTTVL